MPFPTQTPKRMSLLCLALILAQPSPSYGDDPLDVAPAQNAIKRFRDAQNSKQEYMDNLIATESQRNGPCLDTLKRLQSRESDVRPSLDTLDRELASLANHLQPAIDLARELQSRQQDLAKVEAQIQQASINLSKLDQQKNQLSQEIESAKQDLAAFQSQSREKIADWMFQKFNNQTITTKPIQTPSQTIQDVQTLFGVYTIVSPRKLEPSQKSETTVRFTPAVFTQSLFPVSIKTGPLATSVPIPVGLEFKPGKVLGAFGARNFNLSENDFVDVDTRSPITWNWESNATNQFAGARFEIQMQARSDKPADSQKTALDLPVTIEHDPGKPFLERFQALIGTGIGAVWSLFVALVSVTLSVYFTHKFALHREALNREALNRPKPPDPPKIHIR